jgi:4-amino-4-deoxy-L-arabinose transferase-like glycosyltransferase
MTPSFATRKLASGDMPPAVARRVLVGILLISLCINCVGIGWGLPNSGGTWAADSLQPTVPMAVAKHAFFGERWNSGWFYFKYPLGHPLVLLTAQLPYLGWLRVSGQFGVPKAEYPYGFRRPDRALLILTLTMRAVSALMGVGVVALAYATTVSLFGPAAGLAAAALVAGCYPIVFYAHTPNVDVPALFWTALAIAAALRCAEKVSAGAATLAGVAVGMAVLTKEQCVGALIVVPVVWWLRCEATAWTPREVLRCAVAAAVGLLAVTVVVGDVWWNPSGFLNRWRFLMGTLPAAVREKYAPYQFLVQVPTGFSLAYEMTHLQKAATTMAQTLTAPVTLLCLGGLAWALWRRPRRAAIPLVLIASYYVFSLRAAALLPVRYVMPLLYFMLPFGGAAAGWLIDALRRRQAGSVRAPAVVLGVVVAVCALAPGVDLDRLLVRDPRYAAEDWLQTHAQPGSRIEIYQPLTYLPRFAPAEQARRVSLDERTIPRFRERRPDFVVLSSGGRAGLTGRYVRDWQPGKPVFSDSAAAKELLEGLHADQLGYQRVARFRTPTWWITPRINSVNPEITLYAPKDPSAAVHE